METITSLKLWIIGGIITAIAGLGHHFIDNAFCFIDPSGCNNSEQIREEDRRDSLYEEDEEFYDEEFPQHRQDEW